MPDVQTTLFIPKPPAEVYAYAKDLVGLKPYLPEVETLTLVESSPTRTVHDFVAATMGKKIRFREVEEWDDATLRNTFHSPEGDFDVYKGSWVFEPEGAGTKVTLELTYELNIPIFGGLLQKLVKKLMQENVESLVKGLHDRALAA